MSAKKFDQIVKDKNEANALIYNLGSRKDTNENASTSFTS